MEGWKAVLLALIMLLILMVAVLILLVVIVLREIKRSRNFTRGPFHSTTLDIDKICEDLSPTNRVADPIKDQRLDERNLLVVTSKGEKDGNGHYQASDDSEANFNSYKRSLDKKNVHWNFSPIDLKRYDRAFASTDFKDCNDHNQDRMSLISESDGSRFTSDADDLR